MSDSFTQLLLSDFFRFALLAGLILAMIAGPLGSFVVWRRMSFFGDTLAHSALMGIAVGLATDSNPQLSIMVCSLFTGLLLAYLDRQPKLSTDTLLGILAHSSLAIGVVVLALSGARRVNLEAYLFGELLTVNGVDVVWMLVVAGVVGLGLWRFWNELLSITVHAELAEIEGLPVARLNIVLIMMLALIISVSMKLVGVLLITALLIVPPATARQFCTSPETMALAASLLGALAVITGLMAAFVLDTPVGPTIVMMTTVGFVISFSWSSRAG